MSTLMDDLVTTIEARPGASFPELQRVLAEQGYATRGDMELTLPNRDDLVLWSGLSDELAECFADGKDEGLIHAHHLGSEFEVIVVYVGDGGIMNLPRAKRPPLNRQYKEPHWVPIVWYTGQRCSATNCLGTVKGK